MIPIDRERMDWEDGPSSLAIAAIDAVLSFVSSLANFAVGALVLPKDLKMSDFSFFKTGFLSMGFVSGGLN